MKLNYVLPRAVALLIMLVIIASCNEDFETLGSEIVGDQGLNVLLNDEATVIAYNKRLTSVQTNALSKYQLGFYNDPVFGSTKIDLLSQVLLSQTEPDFRVDPKVDSVTIYIPYFSTAEAVSDAETTYTLDSVYGDSPVKIEMFESNFFLRVLDPAQNFEEPQQYFSNQGGLFDQFLGTSLFTLDDFVPSADEIVELDVNDEGEEDDELVRFPPGIRVVFDSTDEDETDAAQIAFFQQKILDNQDSDVLVSNNNFTDFFRGFNLKTTPLSDQGTMIGLNLFDARITIHYNYLEDAETEERSIDIFQLGFSGVTLNTYQNNYSTSVLNEISNADTNLGDDNIFIKGGEGSMGVIELFGNQDVLGYDDNGVVNEPNGVPDELDEIRNNNWLINEANLIFYVNEDIVPEAETEPLRILVYDVDNAIALADYNLDPSQSTAPIINAYTNHLGPLQEGTDGEGRFYKIRITNHINNLVQRDSINRKLGVVVLQQPGSIRLQSVRPSPSIQAQDGAPQELVVERIPEATVESIEGTVLYGNTSPNEEKRLKLQIYYTDPNQ